MSTHTWAFGQPSVGGAGNVPNTGANGLSSAFVNPLQAAGPFDLGISTNLTTRHINSQNDLSTLNVASGTEGAFLPSLDDAAFEESNSLGPSFLGADTRALSGIPSIPHHLTGPYRGVQREQPSRSVRANPYDLQARSYFNNPKGPFVNPQPLMCPLQLGDYLSGQDNFLPSVGNSGYSLNPQYSQELAQAVSDPHFAGAQSLERQASSFDEQKAPSANRGSFWKATEHVVDGKIVCPVTGCGKKVFEELFRVHTQLHIEGLGKSGNKITCPICVSRGKASSSRSVQACIRHTLTTHGLRGLKVTKKCLTCDAPASTVSRITNHMLKAHCNDECISIPDPSKFPVVPVEEPKMWRATENVVDGKIECPIEGCKKKVGKKFFRLHCYLHIQTQQKQLHCPLCPSIEGKGYSFAVLDSLRAHVNKIHEVKNPDEGTVYKCELCPESGIRPQFIQLKHLTVHILSQHQNHPDVSLPDSFQVKA
ncbi:MAG: hypothetical protein S4CHLAM6_03370 [Chlamydiae bacterium]|nr:hypothetical protein [Chlamydiota bacterium]